MPVYEIGKKYMWNEDGKLDLKGNIVASTFAGFFASLLSHPIDVIKTKLMTEKRF